MTLAPCHPAWNNTLVDKAQHRGYCPMSFLEALAVTAWLWHDRLLVQTTLQVKKGNRTERNSGLTRGSGTKLPSPPLRHVLPPTMVTAIYMLLPRMYIALLTFPWRFPGCRFWFFPVRPFTTQEPISYNYFVDWPPCPTLARPS